MYRSISLQSIYVHVYPYISTDLCIHLKNSMSRDQPILGTHAKHVVKTLYFMVVILGCSKYQCLVPIARDSEVWAGHSHVCLRLRIRTLFPI